MLATELNTLAMVVTAVPARLPRFWEIHWDTSDSFWETILRVQAQLHGKALNLIRIIPDQRDHGVNGAEKLRQNKPPHHRQHQGKQQQRQRQAQHVPGAGLQVIPAIQAGKNALESPHRHIQNQRKRARQQNR